MRTLAQAGLLPTVLRLSDEAETAINLADPDAVGGDVGRRLPDDRRLRGRRPRRSTARRAAVTARARPALGGDAARRGAGPGVGAGRFDAPYLRDSLLDVGVLVETLETATFWSRPARGCTPR